MPSFLASSARSSVLGKAVRSYVALRVRSWLASALRRLGFTAPGEVAAEVVAVVLTVRAGVSLVPPGPLPLPREPAVARRFSPPAEPVLVMK